MSTCRMAASPKDGACDENGELWECEGVFVCDGSNLPTASGSNPMITILSMTHMLTNRLVNRKENYEIVKRSDGGFSRPVKVISVIAGVGVILGIGSWYLNRGKK